MNLKQIKDKAIQIIRQYSNGGSLISEGENADYLISMNSLINDAQFELSSIRPIIKKAVLSAPISTSDSLKRYDMPIDYAGFKELKRGDYEFTDFDFEGKVMIIPKYYDGEFTLWYYGYPILIDNDTNDNTELEIDLDLQMVIPYYVAGMTIIDENKDLADVFLSQYEAKKFKTTAPNKITIDNVFGW